MIFRAPISVESHIGDQAHFIYSLRDLLALKSLLYAIYFLNCFDLLVIMNFFSGEAWRNNFVYFFSHVFFQLAKLLFVKVFTCKLVLLRSLIDVLKENVSAFQTGVAPESTFLSALRDTEWIFQSSVRSFI